MSFSSVRKRLQKEQSQYPQLRLSDLQEERNHLWWDLTVPGPEGTPYVGQLFQIRIFYESLYPFRSPRLTFQTPIFHPNITATGQSSNLLDEPWSYSYTIQTLYDRILHLLQYPYESLGYNPEALHLYCTDRTKFIEKASSFHSA